MAIAYLDAMMRPCPVCSLPKVSDNKAHSMFLGVRDSEGHSPGRELMAKIFSQYHDRDGNFVRDFRDLRVATGGALLGMPVHRAQQRVDVDETPAPRSRPAARCAQPARSGARPAPTPAGGHDRS